MDEIAEHAVAEGVMGYLVHALVLIGRHADDVKNQRSFALAPMTPFIADSSPTP